MALSQASVPHDPGNSIQLQERKCGYTDRAQFGQKLEDF